MVAAVAIVVRRGQEHRSHVVSETEAWSDHCWIRLGLLCSYIVLVAIAGAGVGIVVLVHT